MKKNNLSLLLKLIVVAVSLLFFGGCQTPSDFSKKSASEKSDLSSEFKILKMASSGVESSQIVSSNSESWPEQKINSSMVKIQSVLLPQKALKIAVIGDTGCRLKENKKGAIYQNCQNENEWPLKKVISAVTAEQSDFIIHTGDYHYREQCTDMKRCSAFGSNFGYGWGAWWDDFFKPAKDLLGSKPFLFVRGNHEDCERAYLGWKYLSMSQKESTQCADFEPVDFIELEDIVFINLDTSSFEDKKKMKVDQYQFWLSEFLKINEKLKQVKNKEVWLVTHKPVIGYMPDENDAEPIESNKNMYNVLKESQLLRKIDYVLAGHIHNQQIVLPENKEDKFIQLIVGNSGTSLEPFGRTILNGKLYTTTSDKNQFGYAILERKGFKNWLWVFKDQNGISKLKCEVKKSTVNCNTSEGL